MRLKGKDARVAARQAVGRRCSMVLKVPGCKGPRIVNGRKKICKVCHAAWMRKWRKTHRLTPEQRRKDNARSYAGSYKRRGLLVPLPCEVCGAEPAEMHHADYSKPLAVSWLCRDHHLELHRILNQADKAQPARQHLLAAE